jgi:hypothetical protein
MNDPGKAQLNFGASVNMSMSSSGSNFLYPGAGGSADFGGAFETYPTMYDYDTSLTEACDITDKFNRAKEVIGRYLNVPSTRR